MMNNDDTKHHRVHRLSICILTLLHFFFSPNFIFTQEKYKSNSAILFLK